MKHKMLKFMFMAFCLIISFKKLNSVSIENSQKYSIEALKFEHIKKIINNISLNLNYIEIINADWITNIQVYNKLLSSCFLINSKFLRTLTYNELKMLICKLLGHVKFGKASLAYKLISIFIIWGFNFYYVIYHLTINILHNKDIYAKFLKFVTLVSVSGLINKLFINYICRCEEYKVDKYSLNLYNDLYSYKMLLRKLNCPMKLSLHKKLFSKFPSIEDRLSNFK